MMLNKLNSLFKLLCGLSIAGLIFYFIFYIFNAYQSLIYPYQLDFGEGFLLYFAYTLSQGHSIYQDISIYPYIPGLYPPIFSLVCAGLVKIFGISFSTGRFVSVLSAILIGSLIYKIVREKANKQIAIIGSLLFFASPYIYNWTRLFRVDTLALLFSLVGIYFVFKYENNKKVYLSIPFFLLSIYTKQSFIAAPLASFTYLFLKDKKLGIKIICLFGLFAVLLFLLANYITNGQFYLHTVIYNANLFSINEVISSYIRMIRIHTVLFGFAFFYVLYNVSKKKLSLFVIYFIISALVAVSAGKIGSNINYFIELIAVSCILSGMFLGKLRFKTKKESLASILVMTLLLIQLVLFAPMPYVYDRSTGQKISSYILNTNGSILSEDAGFVVINNRDLLIEMFMATQLEKQGLWDQSTFVGDLQNKKFSLIILEFDVGNDEIMQSRFTEQMVKAIRNNYHFIEKIGSYYIYKP